METVAEEPRTPVAEPKSLQENPAGSPDILSSPVLDTTPDGHEGATAAEGEEGEEGEFAKRRGAPAMRGVSALDAAPVLAHLPKPKPDTKRNSIVRVGGAPLAIQAPSGLPGTKQYRTIVRCQEALAVAPGCRSRKQLAPLLTFAASFLETHHLGEEQKRNIAQALYYDEYQAGQTILHMGDVGDRFYLVLFGSVKVYRPNPDMQIPDKRYRASVKLRRRPASDASSEPTASPDSRPGAARPSVSPLKTSSPHSSGGDGGASGGRAAPLQRLTTLTRRLTRTVSDSARACTSLSSLAEEPAKEKPGLASSSDGSRMRSNSLKGSAAEGSAAKARRAAARPSAIQEGKHGSEGPESPVPGEQGGERSSSVAGSFSPSEDASSPGDWEGSAKKRLLHQMRERAVQGSAMHSEHPDASPIFLSQNSASRSARQSVQINPRVLRMSQSDSDNESDAEGDSDKAAGAGAGGRVGPAAKRMLIGHSYNEGLQEYVPSDPNVDSKWWVLVDEVRPGRGFGDVALIKDCLRTATARAEERTGVMVLSKADFQEIKESGVLQTLRDRMEFLHSLHFFHDVSEMALLNIHHFLVEETIESGQNLFAQGDPVSTVYVIREGECQAHAVRGPDDDPQGAPPQALSPESKGKAKAKQHGAKQPPAPSKGGLKAPPKVGPGVSVTGPDSKAAFLFTAGPKSFIGEMDCMLQNATHSYTVTARSQVTVYAIRKRHFLLMPKNVLKRLAAVAHLRHKFCSGRKERVDKVMERLPLRQATHIQSAAAQAREDVRSERVDEDGRPACISHLTSPDFPDDSLSAPPRRTGRVLGEAPQSPPPAPYPHLLQAARAPALPPPLEPAPAKAPGLPGAHRDPIAQYMGQFFTSPAAHIISSQFTDRTITPVQVRAARAPHRALPPAPEDADHDSDQDSASVTAPSNPPARLSSRLHRLRGASMQDASPLPSAPSEAGSVGGSSTLSQCSPLRGLGASPHVHADQLSSLAVHTAPVDSGPRSRAPSGRSRVPSGRSRITSGRSRTTSGRSAVHSGRHRAITNDVTASDWIDEDLPESIFAHLTDPSAQEAVEEQPSAHLVAVQSAPLLPTVGPAESPAAPAAAPREGPAEAASKAPAAPAAPASAPGARSPSGRSLSPSRSRPPLTYFNGHKLSDPLAASSSQLGPLEEPPLQDSLSSSTLERVHGGHLTAPLHATNSYEGLYGTSAHGGLSIAGPVALPQEPPLDDYASSEDEPAEEAGAGPGVAAPGAARAADHPPAPTGGEAGLSAAGAEAGASGDRAADAAGGDAGPAQSEAAVRPPGVAEGMGEEAAGSSDGAQAEAAGSSDGVQAEAAGRKSPEHLPWQIGLRGPQRHVVTPTWDSQGIMERLPYSLSEPSLAHTQPSLQHAAPADPADAEAVVDTREKAEDARAEEDLRHRFWQQESVMKAMVKKEQAAMAAHKKTHTERAKKLQSTPLRHFVQQPLPLGRLPPGPQTLKALQPGKPKQFTQTKEYPLQTRVLEGLSQRAGFSPQAAPSRVASGRGIPRRRVPALPDPPPPPRAPTAPLGKPGEARRGSGVGPWKTGSTPYANEGLELGVGSDLRLDNFGGHDLEVAEGWVHPPLHYGPNQAVIAVPPSLTPPELGLKPPPKNPRVYANLMQKRAMAQLHSPAGGSGDARKQVSLAQFAQSHTPLRMPLHMVMTPDLLQTIATPDTDGTHLLEETKGATPKASRGKESVQSNTNTQVSESRVSSAVESEPEYVAPVREAVPLETGGDPSRWSPQPSVRSSLQEMLPSETIPVDVNS